MQITEGTRLGPYEVAGVLGSGGMGDVYRARDPRFDRDVAIKVLPARLARDEEHKRRFDTEARAASTLSHPNILAVYDMGSHEGVPYVVSELLEGQTLRERLEEGALSTHRALDYAVQIARGLAAAHERGVVHRDLKPANLFVTRDGLVKILDFGLAKLFRDDSPLSPDDDGTAQPTVTRGTTPGSVLGTVGYMSPEQVRGQLADHRSDVFAFGAVLYEMLTGRRAFRGDSAVETMSAILKEEPPEISSTGRHVPPALDRLVAHCLEKRPEDRFQSARDLVYDLESVSGLTSLGPGAVVGLAREPTRRRALAGVGSVLALAVVAIGAYLAGRHAVSHSVPSYRQVTYRRGMLTGARFAPDGGTLVYSGAWEGQRPQLYSARLDTPDARAMGIEDARLVGVAGNGEMAVIHRTGPTTVVLARLPLTGGTLRDVATDVADADWSKDGHDFAVTRFQKGFRLEYPVGRVLVESTGGLSSPRISADGERVAYIEHPLMGDDRGSVVVVDREGRRIASTDGWASIDGLAWSADGREVWFTATRQGALCGLHAVDLAGRVRTITTAPGRLVLQDIADDGRVLVSQELKRAEIYGRGPGDEEERPLSWHDYSFAADLSADGRTLLFSESGEAGGPGYGVYIRSTDGSPAVRLGEGRPFALSPDGTYALTIPLDPPSRITLLPTGAGEPRVLPLDPRLTVQFAGWLPDGDHLFVVASEGPGEESAPTGDPSAGSLRVYEWDTEGQTPLRPLTPPRVATMGRPFTPDGRFLLAFAFDKTPAIAGLYPVDGGDPRPVPHLKRTDNVLGWNADGSALYVSPPGRPRKVERLDLGTGRRQLLYQIQPKDPAGVGEVGQVKMSADGKAYVYNLHRTLSTLFVVEGLR